jgi:hypothetical protein
LGEFHSKKYFVAKRKYQWKNDLSRTSFISESGVKRFVRDKTGEDSRVSE